MRFRQVFNYISRGLWKWQRAEVKVAAALSSWPSLSFRRPPSAGLCANLILAHHCLWFAVQSTLVGAMWRFREICIVISRLSLYRVKFVCKLENSDPKLVVTRASLRSFCGWLGIAPTSVDCTTACVFEKPCFSHIVRSPYGPLS